MENIEIKACRHCFVAFEDTVNRWNQYNMKMHETWCIKNPINISIKKTKINISTGQKAYCLYNDEWGGGSQIFYWKNFLTSLLGSNS